MKSAAKEKIRSSGPTRSYLQTRIRGQRLLNAARILALIELSRRLHQAYRYAYDKQAAGWLLPQNTTTIDSVGVPLLNFKKLLQDTLAYSDCAEFMSKVIAKAGELSGGKNDPVSTEIMILYALVNRQARGGFQLNHEGPAYGYSLHGYERLEDVSGGAGAAWGAWGASNTTVWINQQSIPVNTTANNRARVPFKYAEVALHELFHVAGKNGQYGHAIMDASARFFEPGLSFDQAMKKHCIPGENW